MGEVNKAKTHKVVMDNRNSLSMTGISKVTSIDPDLVLLVTEQGKLKIIGKNMQATNLFLVGVLWWCYEMVIVFRAFHIYIWVAFVGFLLH